MNLFKCSAGIFVALAIVACGGGGGSAGTTSGSKPVVIDVVPKNPLLLLALQDGSGVSTNSIASTGFTTLKATLTDPSGRPIPNQVINVSEDVRDGDVAKLAFPESSTGLTNSAGIALVKMTRASLVATGAGSLTVTYSYKSGSLSSYPDGSLPPTVDTVIAQYIGYQLSASNVTLSNLDVGVSSLTAYGTRQVSVLANIDGVLATSTPVQVSFSATCGQVSPATVSTNSVGVALVTYTATDAAGTATSTQGCSGKTIEISATTVGAGVITKSLNIAAAPATNLSFVSVAPSRIYLANSGGLTQAVVQFLLVNAREEPLLGQDVVLTLKTLNGGIPKASFGTVGNVGAVVVTTDAAGKVSVPVFSGTVPTNVLVNAALVSNPLVQTDSAVLAIASGRPAQARVSLSIKELAIEGGSLDGVSTDVTMSLADRQGNPVPDGTAVNFVTEGGVMIPPTCVTGVVPGNSQCTVQIRAQAPRSADGRVTILAYAAGEEDFVDGNFNNIFDCGETFTDLGTAYRDDNENGTYELGEFAVPRSASSSLCRAGSTPTPQLGDGVWGVADVRGRATLVFATSTAMINGELKPITSSPTSIKVTISDKNGNSMPTGSDIELDSAAILCSINGASSAVVSKVQNTLGPASFEYALTGCVIGDVITVKLTTPRGAVTSGNFKID